MHGRLQTCPTSPGLPAFRNVTIKALVGSLLLSWLAVANDGTDAADIPDIPKPLPPEEQIELFQVPEGFRVEFVAGEPMLEEPTAMAFDAQGRIFVCECHGYNLDGYEDAAEWKRKGIEPSREIIRYSATKQSRERAAKGTFGRVRLLEDTDGDGRMDRSTIWADRLPPCYGVVAAREGVIVLCAPDIVYLADRDRDGRAEVRETLFTGFNPWEIWSRINNPRWGVNNWIYAVGGVSGGGTIRGPALPRELHAGDGCFRFKPDGRALDPVSGRTSGFGQAINDWGDRFLLSNNQRALYVAPLLYRYLARNPYYAAPQTTLSVGGAGYMEVYPVSHAHPHKIERSARPEMMNKYGAKETAPNGYLTAASGPCIYQATDFPPEYCGNHFCCDNAQNMILRGVITRQGTSYKISRAEGEENREFLTSTHLWFRPVNLTLGPDGGLYIVDMYREIIDDYSVFPRDLQLKYMDSLIRGDRMGRIWRVVAKDATKRRKVNLQNASTAELVAELSNANAWWRQTAQRLLVERGDKSAVGLLGAVVRHRKTPQGRIHTLYTLDALGGLDAALIEEALDDPHFAVRVHALRLADRRLDQRPALIAKVCRMIDDSDPGVRLQLAFTLGESKDEQVVPALAELVARCGNDSWVQAAVMTSVPDRPFQLLAAVIHRQDDPGHSHALIPPLASMVGARHDDQEIGQLLNMIAEIETGDSARLQAASLKGLFQGLNRGKPQPMTSPAGQNALRRLLANTSAEVQQLALHVAGQVKLQESPEMEAAFAAAGETALDGSRSVEERRGAVALLASAPFALLSPVAGELLDARQPLDLQLAAVRALSSTDQPKAASVLLANWQSYTPKVRAAVIDAMFSRKDRLGELLRAIDQGTIKPSALDASRRMQLLENSDIAIRQRAKTLLAAEGAGKGRAEIVARYRAALAGLRDPKRGKEVYEKHCAKCHRLKEQGYDVGPDLASAFTRGDKTIVADILDPSSQITVGYRSYTVITEAGRIFTGVLGAETATSITLRKEEKAEETILRRDIDEMAASELSLMPEEMEKEVDPQDVAGLIAFLRETLGPPAPTAVTLFEDDSSFVQALTDGAGKATIRREDRLSGTASLAITPPYRGTRRFPGWEYRIVENPAPGEFRYLRFAWKSRRGSGVMLELAGNGSWPPADEPRWRYYSGKNTTPWPGQQVSAHAPDDWAVVTRDLWRDFGEFTLTGIAPIAMRDEVLFDRIELLRTLDDVNVGR